MIGEVLLSRLVAGLVLGATPADGDGTTFLSRLGFLALGTFAGVLLRYTFIGR